MDFLHDSELALAEFILNRLTKARTVCHPCGLMFGTPRGGSSTFYEGRCDVCELDNRIVTEVRDYNYLARGIRHCTKRLLEKQEPSVDSRPVFKKFMEVCKKAGLSSE